MKKTKEEIIAIAIENAKYVYRDLSIYEVTAEPQGDDEWKVDFDLKDKHMDGGGPHYTISDSTGAILTKRFDQ